MEFLKILGIKEINPGAYGGWQWQHNHSSHWLSSVNPATGHPIAKVSTATLEDYHYLIAESEKAADFWQNYPAPLRGQIVREIADVLRKNKAALGSLIALEMGKTKQEGDGEVQEMIDIADFAVGLSRMLYGKTMHSERAQHRMYEQWHPYGLVGVITAFNFPVAVWAWNAFISAVCGNVTLWKPSSKTPLCAVAVHNLIKPVLEKNQCPPIFNLLIPEGEAISNALVEDKRIPLISFTGSTEVGRQIAEKVSRRLGKSILELGGNNAIIVDETADLKLVIPALVFGAIGTAGQRCTTTRRVFIHKSIFNKVCDALVKAYAQIQIGDPLNKRNLMGPLIDKEAVAQYLQAIQSIQQAGGKIVYGGEVLPGQGYFVYPTLVTHLLASSPLVQKETFAPILYLFPYTDLKEAIHLQNAVPQGLSSALFTQNLKNAEYYLSANGSDCGIANINIGTSGAEIGGAFGGEKETGGGREAGSDAWKAYMRRQTNTINWGDSLPLAQGIIFDL